jgi:hypothetical protein
MKFFGRKHIFEYAPDFLGNRQSKAEEMFYAELRCVQTPEQDSYQRKITEINSDYGRDVAAQMIEEETFNMVRDHVGKLHNCEIDGVTVEDWEAFYKDGPPELVRDISRAVLSNERLSRGERKNFLPG